MKLQIDISAERIANLMISAIEGGDPVTTASRGGWCAGIFWKNQEATPPEGIWYAEPKYWASNFSVQVIEYDETDGKKTSHRIGRGKMATGLEIMATKYPHAFGMILGNNIDAPCADTFLQCVVFGETKYG